MSHVGQVWEERVHITSGPIRSSWIAGDYFLIVGESAFEYEVLNLDTGRTGKVWKVRIHTDNGWQRVA